MTRSMTKAYFLDGGISVELETPFDPETLYVLWKAAQEGAEIRIPVRAGRRSVALDIRLLDHDRTFRELLVEAYRDTLVPSA